MAPAPASDEEYFWARLDPEDAADVEGCWPWQGMVVQNGYGMAFRGGRDVGAHRFAYEFLVGPLGDWHLDHLCRNKLCVNPWHLEKVDPKENAMRRRTSAVCKNGHALVEENVALSGRHKKRRCKTCRNRYARAQYYALKGASA